MSISLNQIIDKCYQIANTHPQVNGFGYGPLYDIVGQEINHPYLWILNEDSHTIQISEDGNSYNAIEYVLTFRVSDKVNNQPNVYSANGENSNNGLEVISDTMQILVDCINAISQDSLNIFNDIKIVDDIDVEPFFHEDESDVNGHQATLTLRVKNDSPCITPLTPSGATSLISNLFLKGIFEADQTELEPITIDADNAGTYTALSGDVDSGDFTFDINGGGYNAFSAPFVLAIGDVLTAKRTTGTSAGWFKITGYYL